MKITACELAQLLEDGRADYKRVYVWILYGTCKGETTSITVTPEQVIDQIKSMYPDTLIECEIGNEDIGIGINRLPIEAGMLP